MLMQACWRRNRCDRPTFRSIVQELLPDLSDTFAPVSYCCSVLCAMTKDDGADEFTDPESDILLHDGERRSSTPSTACCRGATPRLASISEDLELGDGELMTTFCNDTRHAGRRTSMEHCIIPILPLPPPSVPSSTSLCGHIASRGRWTATAQAAQHQVERYSSEFPAPCLTVAFIWTLRSTVFWWLSVLPMSDFVDGR